MICRNNYPDTDDDFDNDFVHAKTKKLTKETKNEKSKDQYGNSILVKVGKNTKNTLYYINQSLLENDGNGSKPCDRSKKESAFQRQKVELNKILLSLQNTTRETEKLCSEMKNEKLSKMTHALMGEISLLEKDRDAANVYARNKNHRIAIQKGIHTLADHWRKRKRKCVAFLSMMEECSDGIITVKKCLSGNGHINLESDEGIVKDALSGRKRARHCQIKGTNTVITDSIVGVILASDGSVRRVTCDDETN